jgi:type IV pilus assembly protein PilA
VSDLHASYDVSRMLSLPASTDSFQSQPIPRQGRPKREWRPRVAGLVQRAGRRDAGFSLIELLIVVAIILIILAIALPQVNKIQMNAREMAAVAQIRTLLTAQTQYMSQFGRYATTLAELGPASGGASEGPSAAGLIPQSLATGTNSGYNFTLAGSAGGYALVAVPVAFNNTGRRTFFADQSGIIHENWGQEPATQQSPEIK